MIALVHSSIPQEHKFELVLVGRFEQERNDEPAHSYEREHSDEPAHSYEREHSYEPEHKHAQLVHIRL